MNDDLYFVQIYFKDSNMRFLWSIPIIISFEAVDKEGHLPNSENKWSCET
jgi:hypothetical protein